MSEQTAESTEATATEAEAPTEQQSSDTEQTQEVDYKAEAEKFKALARKHEERAKSNAEKAKGYDELKKSQMTEQEKAVDAARAEARAEVLRESAPRLVSAEFRAVAAGRLTAEQVVELIEDLDMTKYLTEDGEVDTERVTKKVDALAPKGDGKPVFPDLGQGKRTAASASLDPRAADLAQIEADLAATRRR